MQLWKHCAKLHFNRAVQTANTDMEVCQLYQDVRDCNVVNHRFLFTCAVEHWNASAVTHQRRTPLVCPLS